MKLSNTLELENLYIENNTELGFISIIAIHNTNNGPALGGCRYVNYKSIDEAVKDASNLAKSMTYKSATAGLPLGGGKSVILSYAKDIDRAKLFRSFGKFVNSLNGKYITASDSGTTEDDMKVIAEYTNHVTSISNNVANNYNTADMTAAGVLKAIEAAVHYKFKSDLKGIRIAIQGLGNVGFLLAKKLKTEGAKLIVTDINEDKAKKKAQSLKALYVYPEEINKVECDVFSPCALGGVINNDTISDLNTSIICGAANNQLSCNEIGFKLLERGVLYIPDYIANAGGVICASAQAGIISKNDLSEKINNIYNSVIEICKTSAQKSLPTQLIADQLAESKFNKKY